MKLEVGDLITLNNGDKYITLDKITYNDKSYFFVNKVTSETKEPTEEFYVFTIKDDKLLKITNADFINELLPKFKSSLKGQIESLIADDK